MARTVTPASDFLMADGRTWKSRGEALLALLSGSAAEVPAGLAGLASLPMGYDKAAQNVAGVRQAMSYQPRDPSSLEALGRGLEPIGSALERLKRGMGDPIADRMGPGAGTAAYMIPDALASLVGARYMPKGGPTMTQMAENISQPRQLHPQRGVIDFGGNPEQKFGMAHHPTREQFLGSPRITKRDNAADLKPKAVSGLMAAEAQPFVVNGKTYAARFSPDGDAAVFDGDKVIASYNFGNTLVVDPKYRRKGIATQLVYETRTRFPNLQPAKERTKASQAIQEKVWSRIEAERGR